jgi:hypothetical protein
LCDFGVVRDEDDGASRGVQLLEEHQHLETRPRVEVPRCLVGQNDRRVPHQCPSDGNTLLLATGKLVGAVPELIAQTHLLQHLFGPGVALGAADARIHQRHLHVLHQVEPWQKVVLLEDEAQLLVPDVCQLTAAHLADILAVQQISAFGRHVQTADDIHTSGFTRTGLADDGHELAFVDFERDVVGGLYEGVAHLVILADPIKFYQRAHSSSPSAEAIMLL